MASVYQNYQQIYKQKCHFHRVNKTSISHLYKHLLIYLKTNKQKRKKKSKKINKRYSVKYQHINMGQRGKYSRKMKIKKKNYNKKLCTKLLLVNSLRSNRLIKI